MNETKPGDWKWILGGIALIIVLFLGVKLSFWGLEQAIPQDHSSSVPNTSAAQSAQEGTEAPSFCIHCGKELPELFEWGQFCPYCGEQNLNR